MIAVEGPRTPDWWRIDCDGAECDGRVMIPAGEVGVMLVRHLALSEGWTNVAVEVDPTGTDEAMIYDLCPACSAKMLRLVDAAPALRVVS